MWEETNWISASIIPFFITITLQLAMAETAQIRSSIVPCGDTNWSRLPGVSPGEAKYGQDWHSSSLREPSLQALTFLGGARFIGRHLRHPLFRGMSTLRFCVLFCIRWSQTHLIKRLVPHSPVGGACNKYHSFFHLPTSTGISVLVARHDDDDDEFELTCYDVIVQHFNKYATGTLLLFC